ncbi:hypothetical protein C7450_101321 [Chelatococcus asaccharovorans]|uniref:Uncharacterized protein n=1 Tax=Chelatococcus asaccharovorans TaxID=28210 RepID=A0A2V3UGS9_9HYPH|nr:hypothetical protein C7450_101321 [Chelatococcus asaccharovorans]
MIRVEFSNLTFGLETDIERVPNVKSIPRAKTHDFVVSFKRVAE